MKKIQDELIQKINKSYHKLISILIILILIIFNNIVLTTNAVETNNQANPWTIQKAEHLAKKALFGASKEKVEELFNAGSAISAVDLLFPSISGPDRTIYNTKMSSLLDPAWLIETSKSEMREYYTFKKLEDPYEAKSKLFGMFEDIFSVDTIRDRINYGDIEANHNMLYSHTLGNYKEMIKRNLYNNGKAGDYALSEYLDLLNQTRPTRPNENYAREILQLFLMLEYKPTESEDIGSTRNYTEKEVNTMAKIIFGFEADENTHLVTYNNAANTNTTVEFLEGPLVKGDNFPFYDENTGILDIQAMKTSINGNNGLPDNLIDYIFSKRQDAIAIFLADKLYRFYIAENPTRTDLDIITNKIIENNFEIYPTVKWLLANDMMYSDKSMNIPIYKNPLELIIGTSKIFGLTNENLDLRYSLNNLGWTPYYPSKIFGRDGYDDNSIFFTPYISNKWTTESSILASKLIDNNITFIENTNTATGIINSLENKLYLGKRLDENTKQKLIHYLTHDKDGNEIVIDFTDKNYIAKNIQGLIYIMLNLPEYVLQSGYDQNSITNANNNTFYNDNNNKLVLIKASGGLDWLHVLIPKNEYDEYIELRGEGSLIGDDLISLDDNYYMNSKLLPFKSLFDSGNLKIINRVGTPNHSRGHDSASRKITSIDNKYNGGRGIFGDFIQNEDPAKTIVLNGTTKPKIFDNGNYMGIGSSAIYKIYYGNTSISSDEKEYKINTLKDIMLNRVYVGNFGEVFKNSAIIDSVARDSIANGGREGSGYKMKDKFTFLESLYNGGLGNTAWMRADGGYDTHKNEKDYLNSNLEKVAKTTTDFFNRVKEKNNVTIVIYSEFGRTNKLNASMGVDHGMGGGMFIISNNKNLTKTNFKEKIYGNLSFKNSKNNWLGVGIDYRAVYSRIFEAIYSKDISENLGGEYILEEYTDRKKPKVDLLRKEFSHYDNTRTNVNFNFEITDPNFLTSQASYIKFEYGTDKDNLVEVSKYNIDRYMMLENNKISLYIKKLSSETQYFYKIKIYDNQFNETIIEGSFISPKIEDSNSDILATDTNTRLRKYNNTIFTGSLNLETETSSGIILAQSSNITYTGENNINMYAKSNTYINKLVNNNIETTWNGGFILPQFINKNFFLKDIIFYNENLISNLEILNVLKVGADKLGVGMKLNKEVEIEIPNIDNSNKYGIIHSFDGINWKRLEGTITQTGSTLKFNTNHFSYFIIAKIDKDGNFIYNNSIGEEPKEKPNETVIKKKYSSGGVSIRYTKDVCPYGDYTKSYYDKDCGIDPMSKIAMSDIKDTKEYMALEYLKVINNFNKKIEEKQSDIYKKNININKNIQSTYYKNINGYKITQFNNSKYNEIFNKIAKYLLSKIYIDSNRTKEKLIKYLNEAILNYNLYRNANIKIRKNITLFKKNIILLRGLYKKKKINLSKYKK